MLNLIEVIIGLIIGGIVVYFFWIYNEEAEKEAQAEIKRNREKLEREAKVKPKIGKKKIIVPDVVDSEDSTVKSTQKEECKVYQVNNYVEFGKMEKVVIGKNRRIVKTEIRRSNENQDKILEEKQKEAERKRKEYYDDNPIKENESFISKILNKKYDE